MDNNVFLQYGQEANNWLKRGRQFLLESLIDRNIRELGELEILEIGPGIGQNIQQLNRFGHVDVAEAHPLGLNELRNNTFIRKIYEKEVPFDLDDRYDLICALDVIEHVEDDENFIDWVSCHLKPGGSFIVIVPAYQWLYSSHDRALGHCRRYSSADLARKMEQNLQIQQSGYFNFFLFPLAVVIRIIKKLSLRENHHRIMRKDSSTVPRRLNSFLEYLLLLESKWIRRNRRFPYGLSAYCVGVQESS